MRFHIDTRLVVTAYLLFLAGVIMLPLATYGIVAWAWPAIAVCGGSLTLAVAVWKSFQGMRW